MADSISAARLQLGQTPSISHANASALSAGRFPARLWVLLYFDSRPKLRKGSSRNRIRVELRKRLSPLELMLALRAGEALRSRRLSTSS